MLELMCAQTNTSKTRPAGLTVFASSNECCVCLQWRGAQRSVWSALPPGSDVKTAEQRPRESENLFFFSPIFAFIKQLKVESLDYIWEGDIACAN